MKMPILTYLERLRDIAMDQHGYVTLSQATADGVPQPQVAQLSGRGRIERVAHGVYRVPQVPETPHDLFQLAVLWTGVPEACLSHETALLAWEISDINPERIHITVGKKRRLRRTGGEHYIIHYEDIEREQITWWQGIPTVDIPTSIRQCIEWGVPSYLIKQALERAAQTGGLLERERCSLTEKLTQRDSGN